MTAPGAFASKDGSHRADKAPRCDDQKDLPYATTLPAIS